MSMYSHALLLCPERYSHKNTFLEILNNISNETVHFDVRNETPGYLFSLSSQITRFPYLLRKKWDSHFFSRINERIKKKIDSLEPEIILIYNSEYILPETCEYIKKKNIKLIIFMGDNPYYTPINKYYLLVLSYADLIISPDSFWNHQMKLLGFKNVRYFINGISSDYRVLEESELKQYSNIKYYTMLYVGLVYFHSWGLKKALFLKSFVRNGLKIYGNRHWLKWFELFPELKPCFVQSEYIPTNILNVMYNKTKIVPIDGNPGLLNGFHARVLESLGSGAFPLCEYRKDINELLLENSEVKLPLINNYSEASSLAEYYLKNDLERKEIVTLTRNYIKNNFNPKINGDRIIEYLK